MAERGSARLARGFGGAKNASRRQTNYAIFLAVWRGSNSTVCQL